jgi:hypothetical protein
MRLINFTSSKVIFGSLAAAAFVAMGAASPTLAYEKTGASSDTKEPVKVTTTTTSREGSFEIFPAGGGASAEVCAEYESNANHVLQTGVDALAEGDVDLAMSAGDSLESILDQAADDGCAVLEPA